MKMTVLIIGADSMVGSRFVDLYKKVFTLLTPTIDELNLTKESSIRKYISNTKLDVIINFAAYTDVGKAELERNNISGLCYLLNTKAVEIISEQAHKNKVHLIQISTDMVFCGDSHNPGPYFEDQFPEQDSNLVTWYGFTKGKGEKYIDTTSNTIVRIIYPVRASYGLKLDYFRKILKLYKGDSLYPLFNDQQINITYIDDLCMALNKIIVEKHTGTLHICSPDLTTPYAIALRLLRKTIGSAIEIASCSINSITTQVRYPKYGGLDCKITQKRLEMKFKESEEIIDDLIKQGII